MCTQPRPTSSALPVVLRIALRLAATRPQLVGNLIAHEPPLLPALPQTPQWTAFTRSMQEGFRDFSRHFRGGDAESALKLFIELSEGAGSWEKLPPAKRDMYRQNAWTLAYEFDDPEFLEPAWSGLASFRAPLLFTQGARSAAFFAAIISELIARALPHAQRHTYPDAGHVPHETHPQECARTIAAFVSAAAAARR